ncbi:spermine oxidase isoform X3 [Phymastichus coffea]|uniref:spermine oxidase isoform X3 n=1 Tax=Phymastichus coffea TaxID=108790 RepID=UPI00273CA5FA|nr:spermine oxidase isoform X3 [Phymastichus coffea]
MVTKPKVIIIGAGAAGIAAASRLIEKGLNNVLILEAKNRIGGRIHTVKFSENILELGAQWCHGEENNIIYSLASPHNLLESSSNINNPSKHIFVNSLGEVLSEQESVEIIRIYNKIADMAKEIDYKPGTSYGDYFTQEFYKEIYNNPLITKGKEEEILNFLHNYENSIECSDTWYNISAIRLKDYWQCKGDSLLNWKTNGYSKIFDLLTDKSWLCDLFLFFTVDYQPRILSGWIVGPSSRYAETLSDEKVLNEFYLILQIFLGHIYDIPKPISIVRSKWYSDKHVRGSYSYRSLETEKLGIDSNSLSKPIEASNNNPIVLFAGEATHEHFYSTVHGAIETGFREADRIIEYYRCLKSHL